MKYFVTKNSEDEIPKEENENNDKNEEVKNVRKKVNGKKDAYENEDEKERL